MANPCENVLRVSGNNADILRFDEKFRGGRKMTDENYRFDNLYPTPELSISDKCDWCKEHWSVKGNFYEESFAGDTIGTSDTETYYYFDTPWTAPENLILHTSAEFPQLEFMLVSSETGCGIKQLIVFENGNVKSYEDLSDDDIAYWFGKDEKESA